VTELKRDFTLSLTKFPSLIFVFLVVIVLVIEGRKNQREKKKAFVSPIQARVVCSSSTPK